MKNLTSCINIRAYCQQSQNQNDRDCWLGCKEKLKPTFDVWKVEALKQYEVEELVWRQRQAKEK